MLPKKKIAFGAIVSVKYSWIENVNLKIHSPTPNEVSIVVLVLRFLLNH